MKEENNKLIRLTGMWEKKSKNGDIYFCGKLNEITNIVLLINKFKNNDKSPDYHLCISNVEEKINDQIFRIKKFRWKRNIISSEKNKLHIYNF